MGCSVLGSGGLEGHVSGKEDLGVSQTYIVRALKLSNVRHTMMERQ
jgi:hypothetical protein